MPSASIVSYCHNSTCNRRIMQTLLIHFITSSFLSLSSPLLSSSFVFNFLPRTPFLRILQFISKRENTAPENRKHFFDNPRRYDDESEPLTNRSIKRSRIINGSTGQVSIPSLPDPSHMAGVYGGYGSTSSRQNPYSAPSKYSVNNNIGSGSAVSNYMPGTTPPQLFTSPSFLGDR